MSHFSSMFFHPRKTITDLLAENSKKGMLAMGIIGSIASISMSAKLQLPFEVSFLSLAIGAAAAGMLYGTVGLFLGGCFYGWIGRTLGGEAKNIEVMSALAWAKAPIIAVFIPWLLLTLCSRGIIPVPASYKGLLIIVALPVLLAQLVLFLWSFILLLAGLSEVHGFGCWKAFFVLIIPYFFFAILFFLLFAVLGVGGGALNKVMQKGMESGAFSQVQLPGIPGTGKTSLGPPILAPGARALYLKTGEIVHYQALRDTGDSYYITETDGFERAIEKTDVVKIYGKPTEKLTETTNQ
ncbi:MAG: YIP1 family protein [Candidatus Omnitrophica bacterium]|nr:YIP1 family protein [Candidatus Omnitrophota bacterium]